MAWIVSANVALDPNTVPLWMWNLIAFLKAQQGWTQAGSGDGSTYSNAGEGPVTHGSTLTGGLGNDGAWVRLSKTVAGVTVEWLFYSGGSTMGSLLVSVGTSFTGGSPSSTRRPTASGERFLLGGGTAALPSHAYPCTGNAAWQQMLCRSDAPFGFAMFSYDHGTRANNSGIWMDPLTRTLVSRGAPWVFGAGDYTTRVTIDGGLLHVYRRYGLSGGAWETAELLADADLPGAVGNDPEASTYARDFAVQYKVAGGRGALGDSTLFGLSTISRSNAELYSAATAGDRITMGALILKHWNNTPAA